MSTERKKRLLELVRTQAYQEGDFTLRSGEKSRFYLDGKQITMNAEGSCLLALEILARLDGSGAVAIAGPTLGADPIVGAVCALSFQASSPLAALIIRKEVKDHGTGKLIEGPDLPAGSRVAVVEDVITRGGMVKHSISALEAAGYHVVKVICLVDREAGGVEDLRSSGYAVDPIFRLSDISLDANSR